MNTQAIPFIDFGGSSETLHFLHANGYPPACYQPLLQPLSGRRHVSAMLMRPLWDDQRPEELNDWLPLSQDLLRFLDRQLGPRSTVIGAGHSIGATVTLRAAVWEPQRFRALVLFDPALFQPHFILFWKVVKTLGLGRRLHPFIAGAARRRREFDDLDKLFSAYRERRIFRYFSDQALQAYIQGIVQPTPDGGYRLAFSPEWEAQIYYSGISPDLELWRTLPGLQVPLLIIRGAETDTFSEGAARMIQRLLPQARIVTLPESTHLVPLEKPRETFEIIQSFLEEL